MEEESRKSFAQITLYNQLIKEMDDLYRVYAKNCNLSESAFWILYCIQEREKEAFTQREICDYWFYTPQTEIFLKTMKKHTEFFREEIEELIRQGDPA